MPEVASIILFPCDDCGHPLLVPEALAGDAMTCPNCRQAIVVPNGSDPELRLVFQPGGNHQGQPTRTGDISALLLSGSLKPHHLIWKGGKWQQLSDVFGELKQHKTVPGDRALGAPPEQPIGPLEPIRFTKEDHPFADALLRARRLAFRTRMRQVLVCLILFLLCLAVAVAIGYRFGYFGRRGALRPGERRIAPVGEVDRAYRSKVTARDGVG